MNDFSKKRSRGTIMDDASVTMTHTGIFTRDGKKVVHVCFERKLPDEKAFAEAVIPACEFLHIEGFSEEETEALKLYLQLNQDVIFEEARGINRNVLFRL